MSDEYTPTTATVRVYYAAHVREQAPDVGLPEAVSEFNRWLGSIQADAKAEAEQAAAAAAFELVLNRLEASIDGLLDRIEAQVKP